jgi:hypothetical protein
MNLLFAPPYLEDELRQAVGACEAAAGRLASGDLDVVSSLEGRDLDGVARAALVAGTPRSLWSWASKGTDIRNLALRAASRALAGAAEVGSWPGTLRIEEAELRAAPAPVISRIVAFLHGDAEDAWPAPDHVAALSLGAAEGALAPELEPLALYAALPLAPGATGWWPAEVFVSAEPSFACGAVDITGPARNLTFGPYVCLTPGVWEAELLFDVCPDAARYDYVVDFGVGADYASLVTRPAGPGLQAISLRHAFRTAALAEIRLHLGRPAFHGELRLRGARLTLLERVGPGTVD